MTERTCSVEGCEKRAHCRGWCSAHYERWRLGRNFDAPGDLRRREVTLCAVECCDRPAQARGWCRTHYARWRITGDAGTKQAAPLYRSESGLYIRLWRPEHPLAKADSYVYEHHFVMWEAGVDIRGMHVHHKNHDKRDNRLENLEALTPAEHRAHHLAPGSTVKNQYGTWIVKAKP